MRQACEKSLRAVRPPVAKIVFQDRFFVPRLILLGGTFWHSAMLGDSRTSNGAADSFSAPSQSVIANQDLPRLRLSMVCWAFQPCYVCFIRLVMMDLVPWWIGFLMRKVDCPKVLQDARLSPELMP